ncbi:hypothetical protein Q3G72_020387 [Acer saccharum]|nr:hypothetical protein Q3G72_020387 [Acer saccharum]
METQLAQLLDAVVKQNKGKSPSTDVHINVLEVVEEEVEKVVGPEIVPEQGSERRTRKAPRVPPCVRHADFNDHMKYFERCDMVVERGIAVHELEDTPVPQGLVIGSPGTTSCENGTPQVSELELGRRSLFMEQEASEEIPWKTLLTGLQNLRIDVIENRKQIADSRAEASGYFTYIWGNLTNMREALNLLAYPRKKKRHATSLPPSRGLVIDPDAIELQAVMELSRKEHEERMRAELDPRGKRTST